MNRTAKSLAPAACAAALLLSLPLSVFSQDAAKGHKAKKASKAKAPFAELARPLLKATRAKTVDSELKLGRKGAKAKAFHPKAAGQLGGAIRNYPLYGNLQTLLADPRMAKLSADVHQTIDVQSGEINNERDDLASRADQQDSDEDSFLQEADDLKNEKASLDSQVADLTRRINDYNARCTQAPDDDTYQQCVAEHDELQNEKDQLNAKVDDYNNRADAHNAKIDPLKQARQDLVAAAQEWANKIQSLIDMIQKAFSSEDECTDELKRSVHEICDTDRRCTGEHTCEELQLRLKNGLACEAIRMKVMEACPDDPEYDHPGQLEEVRNAIKNCRYWIGRTCGVGVQPQPGTK